MVERLHLKMKKLGFSICVGSQYSNLAGLAYTEKLSCNAASTWSLDHHRQARGLSTCKARAGPLDKRVLLQHTLLRFLHNSPDCQAQGKSHSSTETRHDTP